MRRLRPAYHPASRAAIDPASYSESGLFVARLAIGVLGVLTMTGEYATGPIRSKLAAAPQRVTRARRRQGSRVHRVSRSSLSTPHPAAPPARQSQKITDRKPRQNVSAGDPAAPYLQSPGGAILRVAVLSLGSSTLRPLSASRYLGRHGKDERQPASAAPAGGGLDGYRCGSFRGAHSCGCPYGSRGTSQNCGAQT